MGKIQKHAANFFRIFTIFFLSLPLIAQQSTASKQVSIFTIEAPQLQTKKTIQIWLPENYSESKKKFAVIYMHDAQNLFDKNTSYVGEWNVDETLDSLNAQVIVVGIDHGNEKRLDELTPYPNEKYGGGKADNYLQFIVETLKPHIDKTYRTKANARNTAIFGSSLGGLVSYYALLKYPKVFGKTGVFSPSFWFSDDIYTLTKNTAKIKSKIYLLAGDSESESMAGDMVKMTMLVNSKLRNKNHVRSVIINGGQHNEKLWRDSFAKAYLWLM